MQINNMSNYTANPNKTGNTLSIISAELSSDIEQLSSDINKLTLGITEVNSDIKNIKQRLELLEQRKIYPDITKLAFYKLQKYIMQDIIGVDHKPWHYLHIEKLFKDLKYKKECDTYLMTHHITISHIYLIDRFINKYKSLSDEAIKFADKKLTKNEWCEVIHSMLEDKNDTEDIRMTNDLINLMETYVKVDSDGIWDIKY
jgi:hypothetical protein